MRNRLLMILVVVGLIAFACGGDDDSGGEAAAEDQERAAQTDEMDMDDEMDVGDEEFSFGAPANAGDADRTIEVVAKDDLTFDPSAVEISKGETVSFVVTNEGKIVHEFVLGDEASQQKHEAQMEEMEGEKMHDEANAIALEAGETKELTWSFSAAGELVFACHEEGHFDAGMIGVISVE